MSFRPTCWTSSKPVTFGKVTSKLLYARDNPPVIPPFVTSLRTLCQCTNVVIHSHNRIVKRDKLLIYTPCFACGKYSILTTERWLCIFDGYMEINMDNMTLLTLYSLLTQVVRSVSNYCPAVRFLFFRLE
jgi:hypothetical protein